MDEEPRITYEPPAIEERQRVIGLMGNSFSECLTIVHDPDICHSLHP